MSVSSRWVYLHNDTVWALYSTFYHCNCQSHLLDRPDCIAIVFRRSGLSCHFDYQSHRRCMCFILLHRNLPSLHRCFLGRVGSLKPNTLLSCLLHPAACFSPIFVGLIGNNVSLDAKIEISRCSRQMMCFGKCFVSARKHCRNQLTPNIV